MSDFKIIDAHAHLWKKQDAVVEGKRILSLQNGKSEFMGEIRQMMPAYMTDGFNSAERFLANMDYARVSAAVITQEYIDGMQNDYLNEVKELYHDRLFCCGMVEMRRESGFLQEAQNLYAQGFKAIKIPAQRLRVPGTAWMLTSDQAMEMFRFMERNGMVLSIDLAAGTAQIGEMEEIIAECPELKIAVGHFGMVTVDGWEEQIKLARHRNVMIESGGITWLFNAEFYPFNGAVKAIRRAADLVGMDKLMWGSDYPRTMVAITYKMSYDFVAKSSLLADDDKALFLGLNAERFYGFRNLTVPPYIKNMVE